MNNIGDSYDDSLPRLVSNQKHAPRFLKMYLYLYLQFKQLSICDHKSSAPNLRMFAFKESLNACASIITKATSMVLEGVHWIVDSI